MVEAANDCFSIEILGVFENEVEARDLEIKKIMELKPCANLIIPRRLYSLQKVRMALTARDHATCNRCQYTWKPRFTNSPPRACARCKSSRWNKPRKQNLQFIENNATN